MGTAAGLSRIVRRSLVLAVGAALLLALGAAPAAAYSNWAHDGIPTAIDANNCDLCHANGISNTSCTGLCHRGFKTTPGATVDGRFAQTCWSCHAPGEDTSKFSSPSAACSQDCHLYNDYSNAYSIPSSHGPEPHLGASPPYGVCLDCHSTSEGYASPGSSPHHDGVASQSPSCTDCHDGTYASAQVSHDGVGCESCHEGMDLPAVPAACNTCHAASTFGSADCRSCHARAGPQHGAGRGQLHVVPHAGTRSTPARCSARAATPTRRRSITRLPRRRSRAAAAVTP